MRECERTCFEMDDDGIWMLPLVVVVLVAVVVVVMMLMMMAVPMRRLVL